MEKNGMKFLPAIVAFCAFALVLADGLAQSKKELTYTKDVAPLIKANCLPCHLEENENPSGLSLDDYEKLMKGGNHGNTVVPGKPKESYLYLKILPNPPFGKQMARNKKKLTEEEMKLIHDWIAQGAKK
jgi:hypothetical protein